MKRRDFIKLSLVGGSAILMPQFNYAATLDLENISFSSGTYESNQAQTIVVFLYGGASQLGGNITNLADIERYSQNSYHDYFGGRGITPTEHGCWAEAGGTEMERIMTEGNMTLYRCCYSQVREDNNNKAHGVCTEQNQKGSFEVDGGGVVANIATILHANGAINENTLMPFVTLEGESTFYTEGNIPLAGYLKPVGINEDFDNPYARRVRNWNYYTDAERDRLPDEWWNDETPGVFDPALTKEMDRVAQSHNQAGKIKDGFAKREKLALFIKNIKSAETPELGDNAYPTNSNFANKLEAAVKLLGNNPDTKIITLGTGGLGGWDDHNDAREYAYRKEELFRALRSAVAHLEAINKIDTVNIMVFGEFGRNVNLNSAHGWDHGNLQNLYVLGGKKYFTHRGVVGETVVDNTGSLNRLWLKPKSGTYWFEPLSIAATLYRIYGIENPNVLTGGNYPPVNALS
jgi:hypothetical protein